MTEQEARTKWCPESRIDNFAHRASFNRYDDGSIPDRALCIASECAMWRWIVSKDKAKMHNDENWVRINEDGYCGLGGKP